MPIIKRYPNRKLYDTEAKRYVTLESITQMIQGGQDVQVIDYETGDDLTNLTLSQIIFEQEKKGSGFLPRSLLTNLIQAGGETIDQVRRTILGAEQTVKREAPREVPTAEEESPLHKVDDIFHDVLKTLNVPTSRDLQRLQVQLDELNAKIATLLAEERAAAAPATTEEADTEEDRPA